MKSEDLGDAIILLPCHTIVLLEALASGVPVAAYPVPGPLDVVGDSACGALNEDLGAAVARALRIPAARAAAPTPAPSPGGAAPSSSSPISDRPRH